MADKRKRETKDRMLMLRMADTEHMRLKLWAQDRQTDMAKVVRGRLADIITPRLLPSQPPPP